MSLSLRNELTLFEIIQEIRAGESAEKLLSKIGDSVNVGGASYFIKSNAGFLKILDNLPKIALTETELNKWFFDNVNDSVYLLPTRVNCFAINSSSTSRTLASYTASTAIMPVNCTNFALNATLVTGILSQQKSYERSFRYEVV